MGKGDIVKGTVSRIAKFGAFVQLEDGSEGFIHISQISHEYVRNVEDFLHVGDQLELQVLGRKDDGKLDLSLKSLEEKASKRVRIKKGQDPAFEKMLKDYLRSSEESHGVLKRRRDAR